jgi:outer membrane immunogenic protein
MANIETEFVDMRLLVSTCFAALAVSGLAQAADLPSRSSPALAPVPAATWEGFYAGTFLSVGQARYEASQTGSRSVSATGSNMGMLAGYNFRNGSWIYGVEGDLGFNKMSKANAGTTGLVAHNAELLDGGHLRARAGYDMGVFLPYAAAGLTYTQGGVRVGDKGAMKTHYGFNVGAGLDWRVQLPVFGWSVLRAEYVYDCLNNGTYNYDPAASLKLRPDAHLFRMAFIYAPDNLGWRAPAIDNVDWSGSYAGFLGGYGSAHAQTKTATARTKLTADSALGGIYAGRNFVFGRWVIGFDGAAMLTDMKGTGTVPGTTDTLAYRNYYETSFRGRAGYAMGRFLPYFAAGFSNGRSEQSDRATSSKRVNVSTNAWNFGAGVDYMLTDRLSTRIEYVHSKSWKDVDVDLNGTSMRQSRSTDMVRAGLAWHFH